MYDAQRVKSTCWLTSSKLPQAGSFAVQAKTHTPVASLKELIHCVMMSMACATQQTCSPGKFQFRRLRACLVEQPFCDCTVLTALPAN